MIARVAAYDRRPCGGAGDTHALRSQRTRRSVLARSGSERPFRYAPFAKGELLVVWGGRIITGAELAALAPDKRHWMLQIDEDLFQLTDPHDVGGADYVNHSCDPNAGILGHIALVALRPIATGEEICFDYGTTDSTGTASFNAGADRPPAAVGSNLTTGAGPNCAAATAGTSRPICCAVWIPKRKSQRAHQP